MENKDRVHEMEFEGKKYIFKIFPKRLICINDNDSFIYKNIDFQDEEIESLIVKKKIKIIKSKNGDEIEIKYDKEDIYDEIRLYEKPNENIKKDKIERNGKKFIKELINDNIYISFTENGKTRRFKITQDNSDKEDIEYEFELIAEGCDINIVNNQLIIKTIDKFVMKKEKYNDNDNDNYIDYYLSHLNDFEEFRKRNEKLIKEVKSKQSIIKNQSEIILKNLNVMKDNAEIIHFPKKRYPIQKDNGINMDTMIISKLNDFKLIDNKLYQIFEKDVEYKLLYRASKDGDTAKVFKEKCKDKNTLTIVLTNDNAKFGGFTRVPWDDSDENKDDEDAFCFSVDNKKIYPLKKYCSAIGCDKNSGPRFNYMFMIPNRFMNKEGDLYPLNISHYNGQTKDYELNKGKQYFTVFELEVFKIKPKN